MGVARRRAINVDTGIIAALKDRAQKHGVNSHSALATMILRGDKSHPCGIGSHPGGIQYSGKSLGVSMRESLWLAVKCRADKNETSNVEAMRSILLGVAPPLTSEEISRGEELAKERELKRAEELLKNPPEKKPRKPRKSKTKTKVEIKSEEKQIPLAEINETPEEMESRIRRQSKLSSGSPIEDIESFADRAPKELNKAKDDDYLGGYFQL